MPGAAVLSAAAHPLVESVDVAAGLAARPGPTTVLVLTGLAVGVVLEGPVVTVVGGSLAGAGLLSFWLVWLVASVADIVSDTGFYALGRWGRGSRAEPVLVRLGLTRDRRAALEARLERSLGQVVVGAKLVDVGAIPALLAIGLTGIRFSRFLLWVASVSVARTGILAGLGWLVGGRFTSELVERPWIIVAVGAGTGLLLLCGRALWSHFSPRPRRAPARPRPDGCGDTPHDSLPERPGPRQDATRHH